MRVVRLADAQAFIERAGEWLRAREAEHNAILADAYLLLSEDHPFKAPFYLASVEDDAKIVGCAVRPPPDGLTLTKMPLDAVPMLVESIGEAYDDLPRLTGPEEEAVEFARRWSRERGCDWSIDVRWRWYKAERVNALPAAQAGSLRVADAGDVDLARAWAAGYAQETRTAVDVQAYFERRIRTRSLYLWDDGGPRALVAVSGLTPATARISAVYTPPEFRRRGYATAVVTGVSRAVLDTGRRICVLFADLEDRSVNAMYTRIGYRELCDVVGVTFSSRKADADEDR